MDPIEQFKQECLERVKANGDNQELKKSAWAFMQKSILPQYSYNFSWLGRPIIQYPQDIVAMQEILWKVQPDLVIETGIAHGGSLIFYSSIMELIGKGQVVGIDIELRDHNRKELENHSMYKRISIIEGSSVSERVVRQVRRMSEGKKSILVCLDSNHEYEHVRQELELYSPLVTKGSYLIVFDTIINDLPEGLFPGRSWNRNNNPKIAVYDFLANTDRFTIDENITNKLLITVAPDGYLKCVKE